MPTRRAKPCTGLLAAALAALLPSPAAAQASSTADVQLLQGWNFHDNLLGYDTRGGLMTTVTVEHLASWAHGDSYAFVDLYRGVFVNGGALTGATSDLYAEWHPRLFLDTLLGLGALGPVRHWGLAGEIDQGRDFAAYLGGLGLDLAVPGLAAAGLNLYFRYSTTTARYLDAATGLPATLKLYHRTWQLSPFWSAPFALGPVRFLFTGFVDLFADADRKLDLQAQPQLLLDLGFLPGLGPGRLYLGTEWYLHLFRNPDPSRGGAMKLVSVPQGMLRWTVFP